jgi:serine acetyltransferase/acyl-CoA synthetase (AMP-forming)/AMP-acid ligase II
VELPVSLGVVETNSIDYIRILFDALQRNVVVAPLRSVDDEQRKSAIKISDVVIPKKQSGWFNDSLELSHSNEIAHISFTSGTEGLPKAVFLARSSLIDVVERVQSLMQMNEEVKEYIGVPVYHSFGYGRCRHVASMGGCFYIPEAGFDPREVSRMLANDEINALSLVPSLLRVFLHNPNILGEERLKLKWLEIGSQAMSKEEKLATRELFPSARIVQHYGLTEASRSTLLQIDGAEESILDSVGKAYGNCEVKINDQGLICIKGDHVAVAIIKEGQPIDVVDENGWFETSDIGTLNNEYLYFEGRADNVVNCGGQKVSTEKLESEMVTRLRSNIAIEVSSFAISRIGHKLYGEGFLLSYTPSCDPNVVKAAALESLSSLGIKASNAISMNSVESIPKTHTGKIQHKVLIADYSEMHSSTNSESSLSDIEKAFVDLLSISPQELDASLSISDVGIDSIQSVQLSLHLESILGYLPADWRELSINDLLSLPRRDALPNAAVEHQPNQGKAAPLWDGSSNMNPSDIGFWGLVKEDYITHGRDLLSQGFFALFTHRFGNWRMSIKTKLFRAPMSLLYLLLIRMTQVFCGIKLDYTVHVGRRVKLEHFGGMILGARRIGDDTIIRQNTTFGIRDMTDLSAKPTIENGVNIGAGAVIVGDITVGRHSVIGPNCVITEDLPPFSVVSVSPCVVTNVVANTPNDSH